MTMDQSLQPTVKKFLNIDSYVDDVLSSTSAYNNIYPFPLSQVVPLSQTDPATDPCRNTKRSDQPDRGAQPARANQTPARWAAREHQTKTGITGRDGRSGPHRISQPIGGHPRNPPVRNRTTGGNRDEAVQRGCTGECRQNRDAYRR